MLFAMDGCEIIIDRPEDSRIQGYFYSAKKKQHSVNLLMMVTLDGRIVWKSPLLCGKCNEQSGSIHTGIRKKLEAMS